MSILRFAESAESGYPSERVRLHVYGLYCLASRIYCPFLRHEQKSSTGSVCVSVRLSPLCLDEVLLSRDNTDIGRHEVDCFCVLRRFW